MDILSTISQSCDSLTASPASAAIATSGHGLALGLGLCVIVYEGVNVSLNAHRGHRIDLMRLGRSLLGVLVVIALVQFYDTPNWILGGYSFKNLRGGSTPCTHCICTLLTQFRRSAANAVKARAGIF